MNNPKITLFYIFPALISLLLLGVVVLVVPYDTFDRRLALVFAYAGVGLLLVIFNSWYERRMNHPVPLYIPLLVASGVWLAALGNFAHLFNSLPWWDRLVHFFNAFVVALIFSLIVTRFVRSGKLAYAGFFLPYFSAVALAVFITNLYEILELVSDKFFGTNLLVDRFDSADDLMFNFLGAICAVLIERTIFGRPLITWQRELKEFLLKILNRLMGRA